MANLQAARAQFKKLSPDEVEGARSDLVIAFKGTLRSLRRTLEDFEKGDLSLSVFEKETEILQSSINDLREFKIQYMKRRDLPENAAGETKVAAWFDPQEESWHQLKVKMSNATELRKFNEKTRIETEAEDRRKATAKEVRDKMEKETKIKIKTALTIRDNHIKKFGVLLKEGTNLSEHATERQEDLAKFEEAKDLLLKVDLLSTEVFDLEQTLSDYVEDTSDAANKARNDQSRTLLEDLGKANLNSIALMNERWSKDENLHRRTLEQGNVKGERVVFSDTKREGGSRSSSPGDHVRSHVKKETVTLPDLKETSEDDAVSAFPIWRKSFEALIDTYDNKYKPDMLRKHLGKHQLKIIEGVSDDYKLSMDRLTQHYGDVNRLVKILTENIQNFPSFKSTDYNKMVEYSQLLNSSFRKLEKIDRGVELSNAYAMRGILNKFDVKTKEDWMDHLSTKGPSPDEFAVLVLWLDARKIPLWKKLGCLSDCNQQKKKSIQAGLGAVRGGGGNPGSKSGCYYCSAKDHFSRDCPERMKLVCDHCGQKGHAEAGCYQLHPELDHRRDGGKGKGIGAGKRGKTVKGTGKDGGGTKKDGGLKKDPPKLSHKLFRCANCRVRDANHDTKDCNYIKKNLGTKGEFRGSLIRENLDCPRCLGDHEESCCKAPVQDCGCPKHHNVHRFSCKDASFAVVVYRTMGMEGEEKPSALLEMMRVRSPDPKIRPNVGVFWDTGATSNFVMDSTAEEFGFQGTSVTIFLQTMEGISERSCISYCCKLRKENGDIVKFMAYGVPEIFEGVYQFGAGVVSDIFPQIKSWTEVQDHLRPEKIDFLLGNSRKSWQPQRGHRAQGGGDCFTMVNDFGSCVAGCHPRLTDQDGKQSNCSSSIFKCQVIKEEAINVQKDLHEIEFCGLRVSKEQLDMKYLLESFNESERLMIANSLACGRCYCNTCPLPGERFSFQGEKDLKHIKSCLKYDEELGRWRTSLPWKPECKATDLPETERVALKTMLSTERSLKKNPEWRDSYNGQIQEFIDRGAARVVSEEELDKARKAGIRLYYLAHLAVDQPGKSTPVRFCVDASRQQMGGPSPNDLLVLGPKSFINNLAGTLLSFRNGQVGAASMSDISKMHQRVLLEEESTFQQLFLWRFCDETKEPMTIAIIVNTFGFTHANCTATASLHMSAEKVVKHFVTQVEKKAISEGVFVPSTETASRSLETEKVHEDQQIGDDRSVSDIYGAQSVDTEKLINKYKEVVKKLSWKLPELDLSDVSYSDLVSMWVEAGVIVMERSYVDDILASFKSKKRQSIVKMMIDLILVEAGMPHKGWADAGEGSEEDLKEIGDKDNHLEKTLGMYWKIKLDEFTYRINVKLSGKSSKKSHYASKWTVTDLINNPPHVLTRRMVLSELAKVFDPLGLISPVLLEAKILIRMSWNGEDQSIPLWDDPLPESHRKRWCAWFIQIHRLEEVIIRRSVVPGGEYEGLPDLVALADGSPVAFGASLYLVYRLLGGGFWSTLLCARSKIAKKLMSTVPRVELNGSLCAERLKNFVKKKTNIKIRDCYQLVDSEVVLHWVSGDKTDLGIYEGTRVSEILATNTKTEDGGLKGWGHVAREFNSSDMCTRPTNVELIKSGFWLTGPKFLSEKSVEDWPVNWGVHRTKLKNDDIKQKIDRDYSLDFESMYGTRDMVAIYEAGTRTEIRSRDTNWYNCQRVLDLLEKHSNLRDVIRALAWVNILAPRLAKIYKEFKDRRILRQRKLQKIDWKNLKTEDRVLSKDDLEAAQRFCVRAVQKEFSVDMEKELNRDQVLKKEGKFKYKKTKYSKLSLFKDDHGIYRVGSRLRMVATVTNTGNMPILIPEKSRFHFLQMKKSHQKTHWGEKGTKLRFRMDGFWALNSTEVARKIIKECNFCDEENPRRLIQSMGDHRPEILQSTDPWSYCELDMFGPYRCKEGRSVVKRWGVLIIDVVSSACYVDLVEDYSAPSIIMCLQRFESFFGWPRMFSSDPGTQLESAGGRLSEWWGEFGKELLKLAGKNDFSWNISPSKSPWRQGKVERSIAVMKRLLRSSIGERQLSTLSLQTALRVCVGIMNSRPLNLDYEVDRRGEYHVISPNDLLLAKNSRCFDISELVDQFRDTQITRNMEMIRQVQEKFYKDISTYVHPKMILREKWHYSVEETPGPGDIVRIHEFNNLGKGWKMAKVLEVRPSHDGKPRSYELEYVLLRDGKKPRKVQVNRSGQRLSLLAKGNLLQNEVEVHEDLHQTVVVPVVTAANV